MALFWEAFSRWFLSRKKEVKSWPMIGQWKILSGTIFINRQRKNLVALLVNEMSRKLPGLRVRTEGRSTYLVFDPRCARLLLREADPGGLGNGEHVGWPKSIGLLFILEAGARGKYSVVSG